MKEVTFGFVKPDAYEHRKEIIEEFILPSGLSVVVEEDLYNFTEEKARRHYRSLRKQPFFESLIQFTVYGLPGLPPYRHNEKGQEPMALEQPPTPLERAPTALYVLEGENAVRVSRRITGPTNPGIARAVARRTGRETIRSKYGRGMPDNAFHSSDSHESVRREIYNLFKKEELPEYVWEMLDREPYYIRRMK